MMFCEDEDGLGFAGCENETGAVDVVADMVGEGEVGVV